MAIGSTPIRARFRIKSSNSLLRSFHSFLTYAAIIFELFDSWQVAFDLDALRDQLLVLGELWRLACTSTPPTPPAPLRPTHWPAMAGERDDVLEWEDALGAAVTGLPVPEDNRFVGVLREDAGAALTAGLVNELRAGMIAEAMPRTLRLLLLALGETSVRRLLINYWTTTPPHRFKLLEAESFAVLFEEAEPRSGVSSGSTYVRRSCASDRTTKRQRHRCIRVRPTASA